METENAQRKIPSSSCARTFPGSVKWGFLLFAVASLAFVVYQITSIAQKWQDSRHHPTAKVGVDLDPTFDVHPLTLCLPECRCPSPCAGSCPDAEFFGIAIGATQSKIQIVFALPSSFSTADEQQIVGNVTASISGRFNVTLALSIVDFTQCVVLNDNHQLTFSKDKWLTVRSFIFANVSGLPTPQIPVYIVKLLNSDGSVRFTETSLGRIDGTHESVVSVTGDTAPPPAIAISPSWFSLPSPWVAVQASVNTVASSTPTKLTITQVYDYTTSDVLTVLSATLSAIGTVFACFFPKMLDSKWPAHHLRFCPTPTIDDQE